MQHGAVADSIACGRIGGIQQSLDLLSQQVGNQASVGFLEGNRQNATNLLKRRRLPMFEIAEERLYGSQTNVSGLCRVLPLILQILQEGAD